MAMKLIPQEAFSKAFLPTEWPQSVVNAAADTPQGTLLAMPNHSSGGFILLHVDSGLQELGRGKLSANMVGAILENPADPFHFLIQAGVSKNMSYDDTGAGRSSVYVNISYPKWYSARIAADGKVTVEKLEEWADCRIEDMEVVRIGNHFHWLAVRRFSPTNREELQAKAQGSWPKPQLYYACTKGLDLPSFVALPSELPIDARLRIHLAATAEGNLVFTYVIAERLFWLCSLDTTTKVFEAVPFKVRGFTGGQYEVMSLNRNAKGQIQMVWYYFNGKVKKETRDHGHWVVTFKDIHEKLKPTRFCEERDAYCLNHIGMQVDSENYYSIWTSGFTKPKMQVKMLIRNTTTGEDKTHTLPGNPDAFFPEGILRIAGKTYVFGYDGKGQTLWEWVEV